MTTPGTGKGGGQEDLFGHISDCEAFDEFIDDVAYDAEDEWRFRHGRELDLDEMNQLRDLLRGFFNDKRYVDE